MAEPRSTVSKPKISLFGRDIHLPRNPRVRVGLGIALVVVGGLFGWLPVLGYWMVPLGLFILAHDSPAIRRFNRRAGVWIRRKFQRRP